MFSQIKVTGEVTDDNKISLGVVTIVNMSTNEKVTTNSSGQFSIEASFNDELRFVKAGYERVSRRVPGNGLNSMLFITLVKIPEDIEEVKLHQKLSGDLSKDSKLVAKVNKGEIIQQAVGLPQPVGKMREKPAEVKQVLLPILVGHLDVQGAYDLISGKARRQKRKYKYDDLQSDIMWIKSRVEEFYFTENGIPKERISEFLEFSFTTKPHVRTYVKAKNLSGVLLSLEDTIPPYVERLKSKGGHSSE
ncbi:carboxypeptidase regulatory-like domain-containing protein [Chryseobacterium sp.]|uniref:carboxypeptidase regulatory-like domain-containing protein n=1 Tax=Chryseobacterium sp. TaxID=1871047 RepID=UPI0025C5645F|nr:carboxypeptidase regulatory-like domain-containing protein [Chryseobacterium sp.]